MKLVKNFSRYDTRKYVFTQRIINIIFYGIACQCMLLIQVQSIVLRITQIDFGVIKKCTMTLDVILPEPETEVLSQNRLVIVLKYVIKRWT